MQQRRLAVRPQAWVCRDVEAVADLANIKPLHSIIFRADREFVARQDEICAGNLDQCDSFEFSKRRRHRIWDGELCLPG